MMIRNSKRLLSLAVAAALSTPLSGYATNGMNMEGYGPIATGMGGASMAYDNGTAALMNNPATLGLMEGDGRLDVALGFLGPDVSSSMMSYSADSSGDAYYMPAVGWVKRQGKYTYGVGMFAQGGMGTEYSSNSFLAGPTGDKVLSEVGVGRLLFPLVYNVDDKLAVGGSIDYVWAGMDLMMPMSADMMSALGVSMGGTMPTTAPFSGVFAQFDGNGNPMYPDFAQFDFADDSHFTQAAKGNGFAGKLGFTYRANAKLTVGATYHSKTSLSDLEDNATIRFWVDTDNSGDGTYEVTPTSGGQVPGKIKIIDFEWPETFGVGMAYQATDRLKVAADVKRINWSDVMKNFKMVFTADAAYGGSTLEVTMPQNWDDQTVYQLGLAYDVNRQLTLRAGLNASDNPIPNSTVNPLFPAIIENHYTFGFGYAFDDKQSVDFSMTYAPEVDVTNSALNMDITHSQTNWQLMYSHNF